ncbi:MAG: hypothetical protein N2595_00985 [bacterium]|nr:hypothetical protein [bacterium]
MSSRAWFTLFLVLAITALLATVYLFGPSRVLSWWNIPVMEPTFSDLYVVTSGAETFAHGLDPFFLNPYDSEGRRLNYPRIWQWLGYLGVRTSHTVPLGITLVALFVLGLFLAVPLPSHLHALLLGACLLSPAVLFAVERGNADLFIFFLLALAIAAARSWALACWFVFCAYILKLYPLAAAAIFLRYPKRQAIIASLLFFLSAAAYLVIISSDLPLISAATPRGASQSYGIHVFWTQVQNANASLGAIAKTCTLAAALLIPFTALTLPVFLPRPSIAESKMLDAFRVGAAVYCTTFLLGNNWDYRLIFLLFAVPQLGSWLHHPSPPFRLLARTALATLLLSLWHFLIARLSRTLPYGVYLSSTLDEAANWLLFASLLSLLTLSSPPWLYAWLPSFQRRPSSSLPLSTP